jgi:hypothetical protein
MDVAEFDQFADEYYRTHAANISASGETPDYFAEYKIKDIVTQLQADGATPRASAIRSPISASTFRIQL